MRSVIRQRLFGGVALVLILLSLLFTSGCDLFNSNETPPSGTAATTAPAIAKPHPVVKSVEATTSGMGDNYYAILEITIENKGSDGTAVVKATLTQAGVTQVNEMVTNINKDKTQVIRLVFPLKWKGGEPTQTVEVSVP